jgi:hypothetical protein
VHGSADGLNTGILAAVVIAWSDNVAVECAADLFAIFKDGRVCANLHDTVFDHFDAVNDLNFFESHFDNPIKKSNSSVPHWHGYLDK